MAITELQAIAMKSNFAEAGRAQSAQASGSDGARREFVERRRNSGGRLGNRRTDNWMPYSTPFVAQLLGQQLDEQLKKQLGDQADL